MEERKKRGLCYNCDDKWAPGHKCKQATLFLLEGVEVSLESIHNGQYVEDNNELGKGRRHEEETDP